MKQKKTFLESLELIERVRPNKVNITRYSKRRITPVSSEKDLPDWFKKDRSRAMNTCAESIMLLLTKNTSKNRCLS